MFKGDLIAASIRGLGEPRTWSPALAQVIGAFLLSTLFEKLMFFSPWSLALFFVSASAWPLSFQKMTLQKGLQAAFFFVGFLAIFLAVQLCYFFTAIPSIGPLISSVPILFILFVFVVLALIWPALFFAKEISKEELLRLSQLFREKPKKSATLFGIAFAPLALSGLLYVWARLAVFSIYGPIGTYAQAAALWPFLLLMGFSMAFFLQMAKQVKR